MGIEKLSANSAFLDTLKFKPNAKRVLTKWVELVTDDMFPHVEITKKEEMAAALLLTAEQFDHEIALGHNCSVEFVMRVSAYFDMNFSDALNLKNSMAHKAMIQDNDLFLTSKIISLKRRYETGKENIEEFSLIVIRDLTHSWTYNPEASDELIELGAVSIPGEHPLWFETPLYVDYLANRVVVEKKLGCYVDNFTTIIRILTESVDYVAKIGPKTVIDKHPDCFSPHAKRVAESLLRHGSPAFCN